MCDIISEQAKQQLTNVIAQGGRVCVTLCCKFTPTVVKKVLELLSFTQTIWNKHATPEANRKISVYPVLCYYNGQDVPAALKVQGLEINVKPVATKFESPLSREGSLMVNVNEHMGLFHAGPDYFGFKTMVEESPFLLTSEVGKTMIAAIYQSIGIDGNAALNAIKAQADTKTNVYDNKNIIQSSHDLIQAVHKNVFNMDDNKYKESLMFLIKTFDHLAVTRGLTVEARDYDTMTIPQLINAIECHVDSNNANGLAKGVLMMQDMTANSERLDDGVTLQKYTQEKSYKPCWALGKLLVSTLSRKQLLGSRLDFEEFFNIFHHIVFGTWAATFAEAVEKFVKINTKEIHDVFHLQIGDGEADDMSYNIIGRHMKKTCESFHFFSTWQISVGYAGCAGSDTDTEKTALWDHVQNPNSPIRQFMQDDLYFADPNSSNQNAVLTCVPNLVAYLNSQKLANSNL